MNQNNQKDKLPISRNIFMIALMLIAGLAFGLLVTGPSYAGVQGLDKLNQFLQKTSTNDPALKQLREGRDAIEENDWERAAELFNDFISDHSKHKDIDQALYWLSYSQYKMEDYKESVRNLTVLLKDYPKSTWVKEAETLMIQLAPKIGDQDRAKKAVENNPDEELKLIALQSLCQGNPERCMEIITEQLKAGTKYSRRYRENVISLLGQYGGRRAAPALKEIIRNEQDIKLRKNAIYWLSQTNDEESIDIFKDIALNSKDPELIDAAIYALSESRSTRASELITELAQNASSPKVRVKAIYWLGQRRGDAVIDQLMRIYNNDQDTEVKKQVIYALSQRSSTAARAKLLEIAISSTNATLKKDAIYWLGQSGGEQSATDLIKIYDSETNDEIRKQVLYSLSQMRSEAARNKLMDVAKNGNTVEVRKQAIYWVTQMGGSGAAAADMTVSLYDSEKNPEVKKGIIYALGQMKAKSALRKLMDIAKTDSSLQMRKEAVYWLGQSKDPEALKFLEDIIK